MASKTFACRLTAPASVSALVIVQADTEEEAKKKAYDDVYSGVVEWHYDGCDDGLAEVVDVEAVE